MREFSYDTGLYHALALVLHTGVLCLRIVFLQTPSNLDGYLPTLPNNSSMAIGYKRGAISLRKLFNQKADNLGGNTN